MFGIWRKTKQHRPINLPFTKLKKLLYILPFILFACKKEVRDYYTKHLVLEVEQELYSTDRRPTSLTKKRPKKDTTIIVYPPEVIYNRVIHIETKGCWVSGTSWNANGDFYATPSSLPEESIQSNIEAVKAAYSAFNVIVTRDESIYNLTPKAYRQKEIWTDNWEWYGYVGGVAYRNSFGTEQPCFVFTSLLGATNTIQAAVHELGHTLGLPHKAVGYWAGSIWYATASYSLDQNWMGAGYSYPYHIFETDAVDYFGNLLNQPQIIKYTLSK